MKTQNGGGVA